MGIIYAILTSCRAVSAKIIYFNTPKISITHLHIFAHTRTHVEDDGDENEFRCYRIA